jgi:hypothetical protein
MHKQMMGLAFCIAVFATSAAAQTNTFPASGNVGIGTTTPSVPLEIWGSPTNGGSPVDVFKTSFAPESTNWNLRLQQSWPTSNGYINYNFIDRAGGVDYPVLSFYGNGNVGIATTAPAYPLDVNGNIGVEPGGNFIARYTTNETYRSTLNWYGLQLGNNGNNYIVAGNTGTGGSLNFIVNNSNSLGSGVPFTSYNGTDAMVINNSGNVGIGTTAPAYKLDVAGQIRTSSGGIVFPDGSTQTTAFNPTICGGDYAESVEVTGARTKYEPGDVLVIDPKAPGKFLRANQAYSTLVAGIYSTKPGTVGRRQTTAKSPDEIPMAVVGIVPIKVSTENGPIKPGDLLVASSTLGRAMKGTDRSKMLGAVVGKALGNLDSGTGVIEVLVTLQ